MKFLIDEDVAIEIVRSLRQNGHEALLVFEVLGARTPDDAIWNFAIAQGAVVVTCNRDDFLKLAAANPETGLLILNRRRTRQSECAHVLRLLAQAGESGLQGNINFA